MKDGHCEETIKVYIEAIEFAPRVANDPDRGFREGKSIYWEHARKTATIVDLRKEPGGQAVLGSNPLAIS